MKLCPQCDFIYEDNQRFCDMDGKQLVHEHAPVATEQSGAPQTNRISPPARSRTWRFPVPAIAGVVLATLVSVSYFARPYRWLGIDADLASIQSSEPSTARDRKPETSHSAVDSSISLQSPERSGKYPPGERLTSPTNVMAISSASQIPQLSQSPSRAVSVSRARLVSSPVAAGGLARKGQGPVIVRLTNGATIKADEAWEKREGVWYRQAGMVTFLKRGRVRTIEQLAAPHPQLKSSKKAEETLKSENIITQNQLSIRRLEAATAKKQSHVKSFLKRTGRILKKPFQF